MTDAPKTPLADGTDQPVVRTPSWAECEATFHEMESLFGRDMPAYRRVAAEYDRMMALYEAAEEECPDCGSSRSWVHCEHCEEGFSEHDCGEDCCACADPVPNVRCDICNGKCGWWVCESEKCRRPNARPVRADGPPRDSGTHEAVVGGAE